VAVRFSVRLTPRGGSDRVEGVVDGQLRARVRAAPEAERANEALRRLVAETLGVPLTAVRLSGGRHDRTKRLAVDGLTAASLRTRWPDLVVVDARDRPAG
jgi:uncharacterized protein YggU (UPF0235/DUF167 family)